MNSNFSFISIVGILQFGKPWIFLFIILILATDSANEEQIVKGIDKFFTLFFYVIFGYSIVFEVGLNIDLFPKPPADLSRFGMDPIRGIFKHPNTTGVIAIIFLVILFQQMDGDEEDSVTLPGNWFFSTAIIHPTAKAHFDLPISYIANCSTYNGNLRSVFNPKYLLFIIPVVLVLMLNLDEILGLIIYRFDITDSSSVRLLLFLNAIQINVENLGFGLVLGCMEALQVLRLHIAPYIRHTEFLR